MSMFYPVAEPSTGFVMVPDQKSGTEPALVGPTAKTVVVSSIVKKYGDFLAIDDVSFRLERGEFLTLLGPSGSGKTSTLMMVAGFETPSSGRITVDERDVVALSPQQRNFGVVFQGYALFPHMTARENVEFPLRMRNYDNSERRRLALEMLDRVGLSSMTERRPRELSGGQQQRVALARALVFHPDALLLDEPLGALDKGMRERMQYEIKELQKTLGISVLFVTHDQDEAMSMSDRIAVMNKGKIVQIGSPKEVYSRPEDLFVANFLGESNFLDCRLGKRGGDTTSISIPDGQIRDVPSSHISPNIGAADDAVLFVRPERVAILHPKEQADFIVRGTVTGRTFVGRHSRFVVEALGTKLSVIVSDPERAEGVEAGSELRLGWKGADAQILPAA